MVANVLWMSQNIQSEWNTAQFNLVKLSLSVRAWVPIIYSLSPHFQWLSGWMRPLHCSLVPYVHFWGVGVLGEGLGRGVLPSLCFLFSLSFISLSKSHYSLSNVCYLTFLSTWFDTCLFSEWVLRNPFANPCCLFERMDSKHVSTSKSLYPYIYLNLSCYRLFYKVKLLKMGFVLDAAGEDSQMWHFHDFCYDLQEIMKSGFSWICDSWSIDCDI